jgi:hypothetical protein
MTAWEWTELPTADLSLVGPDPNPRGWRAARINAWNGMTALGGVLCMAGVGGHADWAGNEAYSCDLSVDEPTWSMLGHASAAEFLTRDAAYYTDGRPTSSHTYYALQADVRRERIFRLGIGSGWGSGNFQQPIVDAFALRSSEWDAAGTWPSAPESLLVGLAQAQDPTNGDVYVVGRTKLWRFRMESGTWTELARMAENGTATYYRASAVDVQRQRLVVFGNRYQQPLGILIYDIAANRWQQSSLSGDFAQVSAAEGGQCAHYHAPSDRFLLKTSAAGQLIEIHPETFMTRQLQAQSADAVPNAVNGVFGKFVHMPALRGFAYQPDGLRKLWFIADSAVA